MIVRDDMHRQGLGTKLLESLLQFGQDEGIKVVEAYMLGANKGMLTICKRLGFNFEREGDLIHAAIDLKNRSLADNE